MIRTYLDSGILIIAARGVEDASVCAISVLGDPEREFVSSLFLKLEVLPKAIYNQQLDEVAFYEDFFGTVTAWASDYDAIAQKAYQIASSYGLAANKFGKKGVEIAPQLLHPW
jgi:hypothetical protein